MSEKNVVVGICGAHTEAEAAVKELEKSHFAMGQLSRAGAVTEKAGPVRVTFHEAMVLAGRE